MALFIVDKEGGRWRIARATSDGPNVIGTSGSKTTAVKDARKSAKNWREKHDGQVLLLVFAGDDSVTRATKYRDGDEFVSASAKYYSNAPVYPYALEVLIENPAGVDMASARYELTRYMTKRAVRSAIAEIGQ